MDYLFDRWPKIKRAITNAQGLLLMLDFDGTLSPIAPTPAKATLPATVKTQLKHAAKLMPVAIISGRPLANLKQKVRLQNLIYAGSHGLEWQIGKQTSRLAAAKRVGKPLGAIKPSLQKLIRAYPGSLLENKTFGFAIHYRGLTAIKAAKFQQSAEQILRTATKTRNFRILSGKKILELQPNLNWHKGKVAKTILRRLQHKTKQKRLPIYVGDDVTDEDAFRELTSGLTIRVGQAASSRAKYFIKNPAQIALLLRRLTSVAKVSRYS